MNTTLALPCTAAEARALTDRIRDTAGTLHDLLLEAYARGAWSALGYDSWREYATAELSISKSHAYRLLDQARVIAAISEAAGDGFSPNGEITEAAAREIKPALPEVVEAVRAHVAAGVEPAVAVRAAVEEARTAGRRAVQEDEPPTPPAPAARPVLVEDEGAVDTVALLEEQERRIAELERLNDSLSASDQGAEVKRLALRVAQLEAHIHGLNVTLAEAQKDARHRGNRLAEIRKALGVERDSEILPALTRRAA